MTPAPHPILQVACFVASPILGWLFAEHVDPHGALLRFTIGWLVGEFR